MHGRIEKWQLVWKCQGLDVTVRINGACGKQIDHHLSSNLKKKIHNADFHHD